MGFVHGTELTNAIRSALRSPRREAAVAFWGSDAMQRLGIADAREFKIACDLQSGACNPKAIKQLKSAGAEIYDVPGLHAKVYIGADQLVTCSANVSANGLGEEGEEVDTGLEAGFSCRDVAEVENAHAWFGTLISGLCPIEKEELKRCKEAWDSRRTGRPFRRHRASFLDALMSRSLTLRDRKLKLVIYEDCERDPNVERRYRASGYAAKNYDGTGDTPYFWDCPTWQLVDGDLVLSISADEDGTFCEGVWRVITNMHNGELVPLAYVKHPIGLKFSAADRRKLSKLVARGIKAGKLEVGRSPMALEELELSD